MAYSLRSIVKGTSIYTLGSVLIKASGFLLIPVYTRYLSPSDYGVMSIVAVIVAIMTATLSMGMFQSQTRFYYDFNEDRDKVGRLLFTINVLVFSVALVVCIVLSVFGEGVFARIVKSDKVLFYPFVIIAIWTAFFHVFNQLVANYYIAAKKYAVSATLLFLQFLITVACVIYFVVFLGEGALGGVKGILIAQVVSFAAFYWRYALHFVRRLNARYLRDVLAMGLPVTIHATSTAVLASVDKLIVEAFLPMAAVGLYTLGYKFGLVMSVIVVSVNRAWLPNYFELMKQPAGGQGREIRRMLCLWMTGLGAMCVAGSVWSDQLVRLMAAPDFHGAANVVPMVLLAYFFQGIYFFMISPLFYFKKTAMLPLITVAGATVNVGLNFILIPRFGIMGAAGTALISYAVLALLAWIIGLRYYNPRFELVRLTILILAVSALSVGGSSLGWPWAAETFFIALYVVLCFILFPGYLKPLAARAAGYLRPGRPPN
jgi:O-antigen/teichoic acid export membrane protein